MVAFHIREQATDIGMGMLLEFLPAEGLNKGGHKGGQTRQHLVEDLGSNLTFRQQLLLASSVSRFHPRAPSVHRLWLEFTEDTYRKRLSISQHRVDSRTIGMGPRLGQGPRLLNPPYSLRRIAQAPQGER